LSFTTGIYSTPVGTEGKSCRTLGALHKMLVKYYLIYSHKNCVK